MAMKKKLQIHNKVTIGFQDFKITYYSWQNQVYEWFRSRNIFIKG